MHFQSRMNTDEHRYKAKSAIKVLSAFICVHLWLMIFCFLPAPAFAAETLTVAVASSLYPAMQQKAEAFEKEYHVTVRLVPGSTGRLYNQIMQGAPFDLFIAADQERPVLLMQQHKAMAQFKIGQGYLGVKLGKQVISDISVLANPTIRHIAIANPDVAPFGKAARAVLQKQGLWSILKHKFVYAQNAMQAAMMVDKGLVDAGFVPVSPSQYAIAAIHYRGVRLSDKKLSRVFLETLQQGAITPGSAALAAPKCHGAAVSEDALPDDGMTQDEYCLQRTNIKQCCC